MNLKAGNVVGIRINGDDLRNDDGSPLTWIIEDQNGEEVELYVTVGRMGTYAMFTLPPFRVTAEGDFGDSIVKAKVPQKEGGSGEGGQTGQSRQRVAVTPRRDRTVVP